jgi:hypothetical protein
MESPVKIHDGFKDISDLHDAQKASDFCAACYPLPPLLESRIKAGLTGTSCVLSTPNSNIFIIGLHLAYVSRRTKSYGDHYFKC